MEQWLLYKFVGGEFKLARERTYDGRGRVERRARDEVRQYFPRVSPSRPTSHHLVNMF
jgi:hypothetical protein